MKLHQISKKFPIILTNEESRFIKTHGDQVSLKSLDEHGVWLAQNLVRKNIYKIIEDNTTLILNKDESGKTTL